MIWLLHWCSCSLRRTEIVLLVGSAHLNLWLCSHRTLVNLGVKQNRHAISSLMLTAHSSLNKRPLTPSTVTMFHRSPWFQLVELFATLCLKWNISQSLASADASFGCLLSFGCLPGRYNNNSSNKIIIIIHFSPLHCFER